MAQHDNGRRAGGHQGEAWQHGNQNDQGRFQQDQAAGTRYGAQQGGFREQGTARGHQDQYDHGSGQHGDNWQPSGRGRDFGNSRQEGNPGASAPPRQRSRGEFDGGSAETTGYGSRGYGRDDDGYATYGQSAASPGTGYRDAHDWQGQGGQEPRSWQGDRDWQDRGGPSSSRFRQGQGWQGSRDDARDWRNPQDARGPHGYHDADYHQWREEQLRRLDSDYDEWRQHRYQRFTQEFNDWRGQRDAARGQQGGNAAQGTDAGSQSGRAGTAANALKSDTQGSADANRAEGGGQGKGSSPR